MAGTKKTIFWHGQKKHNAGSACAKDQMTGSKVACSHKGCPVRLPRSAGLSVPAISEMALPGVSTYKFVDSSGKSEFRKKQGAAAKKTAGKDRHL
ncbi:hypothetical protein SLS62_003632 [Diatrype stigma]|uniref:Uncharacterized protein n=1 Tax=Diatrype stigma TaxID=117547 RepID=A0AAN9YU32_9PEZI